MKSDVWKNFVQTSDLTVKAFMVSNSLYHRNFQMTIDMKVKICFYAKLCTQKKILASKNAKSQTTKDFRFRTFYLEKVDCQEGLALNFPMFL